MKITEVKIRKLYHESKLRALVSITIDGEFAIHDIKVIQGSQRLFVAMPNRREENGVYRDIVHPISPSCRKQFEDQILIEYERQLANIED